jgi:UDP-glucuronate decarboxylase
LFDNYFTGSEYKLVFELISPVHYQYNPIKTIKTFLVGERHSGLAKRVNAKNSSASTSEVYGDPEVHPQISKVISNVTYRYPGSCYDEGKLCRNFAYGLP